MDKRVEERVEYYMGYLCALQDVARALEEPNWTRVAEILAGLLKHAVQDIIRETEKEVKVPNDTA